MRKDDSNEIITESELATALPDQEFEMDFEERSRQIARKVRRRRIFLRMLLAIAVVIALGIVIIWKVYTVEEVKVVGNKLHSAKTIEKTVLSGKHSWNSLYVYLSYRMSNHMDQYPYADAVEVSLDNPHILRVQVKEKEVIGYFYSVAEKKYIGFGETGEVLLVADQEPEGYIRVTGIKPQKTGLYQNMDLEDADVLSFIRSVTSILQNYELQPDVIYMQKNGSMLLSYGDIQVCIGDSYYLNEKIVRMQQLMKKLTKQKGTLHLETWTESSTDIYFRKNELTKIPK